MARSDRKWRTAPSPLPFVSRSPAPDPAECRWVLLALAVMSPVACWKTCRGALRARCWAIGAHPWYMSPARRRAVWRRYSLACELVERWCRLELDPLFLEIRDALTAIYAPPRPRRRSRRREGTN